MPEPKRFQCRHIHTSGQRCGSPCLRQEQFCYYHHTTRRPATNPRSRRSRQSGFTLPLPEDRSAIQASIGEILRRIAANELDTRRAGLLLYGLQIASLNLPKPVENAHPAALVEEVITDPQLGTIAPQAELRATSPDGRVSIAAMLLAKLNEAPEPTLEPTQEPTSAESCPPLTAPEPITLPTLQATATRPSRQTRSRIAARPRLCRHSDPERSRVGNPAIPHPSQPGSTRQLHRPARSSFTTTPPFITTATCSSASTCASGSSSTAIRSA